MNQLPQKTSLVAQTAAVILDHIRASRWTVWLPGEHELSAQLQVSRRTVRAALEQLSRNGDVRCKHGHRREIINRDFLAKKSVSRRVLLLMPEPLQTLSPLVVLLVDRLRTHLIEAGYVLETHASRLPYRLRSPKGLESLAKTKHPAGWVLLQSTEPMQRWFAARGLPCVIIGSRYNGIALPSIDRDHYAISQHAVNQFITRGYKRLAILTPQSDSAGDVLAIKGFQDAIEKSTVAGLQGTVQEHDGSVKDICAQIDKLMSRANPPNAFLVCRAHHVLTVLGHLLSNKVRVPQDVAIISRDDDSFLRNVVPTVARYSHSQRGFETKISRVVMKMLLGELLPEDYKIMPLYIPGETLD
ncbi:MAG: transcriptional regulator [Verrucomicrobiales bacterium]|nr:transcriptional regulator [Verrucomicrobiales bacterium]